MVSVIRHQHPSSRSAPSTGALCTHEPEQKVRDNHGCSDERLDIQIEAEKKPSNHALEQVRDHELKKDRNAFSERREALFTGSGASSEAAAAVPTRTRRWPFEQVKKKMMSMSSIRECSNPAVPAAVKVVLKQDLNELPAADSDETMPLPVVKVNRTAEYRDLSAAEGEDIQNDELDQDLVISEEEYVQYESSGEMSDCSIEGRYITEQVVQILKSHVRKRLAFRRKEKRDMVPDRRLVDIDMTDMQSHQVEEVTKQAKREYRGSSKANKDQFPESKVQAEVGAPISNGHFVGASSTVNNDQLVDEDDPLKTLPEGSLKHAVYSVVMVHGREGISREDLLSSLYSQTKSAMLADDWEDDVKKCLKSLDFVKVQGQYILRSQLLNHPCSRRSHAKGKERVSEIGSHQLDCEGPKDTTEKGETVEATEKGMSSMLNKEPVTRARGRLLALHAKMTSQSWRQEGVRQCSASYLKRVKPWRCPLPAMDNHKLCKHHFHKNEGKNKKRRKIREGYRLESNKLA
ncbi:hypothetical protein KC19_1G320900 [Ceratodon purpureus]|uniref:WRC domain-containing protein n=1 Tax=Ceratodon purpureus TaxID=3225 RepID=A0A8T0JD72_CERPU|nr:hypothetical protein KC19_1G320900 [Ceratodon purpureus]